jgi:hypothetical protein
LNENNNKQHTSHERNKPNQALHIKSDSVNSTDIQSTHSTKQSNLQNNNIDNVVRDSSIAEQTIDNQIDEIPKFIKKKQPKKDTITTTEDSKQKNANDKTTSNESTHYISPF